MTKKQYSNWNVTVGTVKKPKAGSILQLKTGSRRSRYNQLRVRANGKNRVHIAIYRRAASRDTGRQNSSTAFRRLQALIAGIVLAAAVAGILPVMLVVSSVIAVVIGITVVTAIALAIVVAAFRRASSQ